MHWPEVLAKVAQCGPYPSIDAVIAEAARYREGVTHDALISACRRYRAGWRPGQLVGDVADEWDDEPTQPSAAPLQPMRTESRIAGPRMTLVPGDIHIPIWERELVFAVLRFAVEIGVDHLCLAGDLFDTYGAGRWSKEAGRYREQGPLVEELRAAAEFMRLASDSFERIDWMAGNHEARALERFVSENPWLYQHPAFDPRSIFQIPERWQCHDPGSRLRIGSVCIEHGEKLKGSGAKYGAANVLRNNPYQHTIFGHTHRVMQATHTVYGPDGQPIEYSAQSCGHLSQLRMHSDYATQPNWCHAFALIEHGINPSIYVVKIHRGRWRFGGREYGI